MSQLLIIVCPVGKNSSGISISLSLIENILVRIGLVPLIARRIKQHRIRWAKVRGIPWFTYKYCTRVNLLVTVYTIIYHFLHQCFSLSCGPYFHSWLIFYWYFPSAHYKRLRLMRKNVFHKVRVDSHILMVGFQAY